MKKISSQENLEYACDADVLEYEIVDGTAISISAAVIDQQLTYTQRTVYSITGITKQSVIYAGTKLGGCFAVAIVAPPAYLVTANYFCTPGVTSGVLARSTGSAIVSMSFDLGSKVGSTIAETTWDASSAVISRAMTYWHDRASFKNSSAVSAQNSEKNKKNTLRLLG